MLKRISGRGGGSIRLVGRRGLWAAGCEEMDKIIRVSECITVRRKWGIAGFWEFQVLRIGILRVGLV